MTYYGVLKDSAVISNNNLLDLIQTPGLDFILRFDQPLNTLGQYTMIHRDGTVNFLRVGDFELRSIGSDGYDPYGKKQYRIVSICELKTQNTYHFTLFYSGAGFLKRELIPLMNKLNELGSYEMYRKSLEFDKIKEDNEGYRKEIEVLKSRIIELENSKGN